MDKKKSAKNFQKRIFPAVFIAVIFLVFCNCSNNNYLIRKGRSDYHIFVSAQAGKAEKYAALELQKYLKEISGCELPVTHSDDPDAKMIYVGFDGVPESVVSGLDLSEFGKEEYIIRTRGEDLLITGGKPRGTLYGVFGFLSDHLGCRWYTREVTKIPRKTKIVFPEIEDRQKPAFEYREAWYMEAYDMQWAVHNRLNPSIVPIPDSLGGSYICYPFVHTFYQLVPPDIYFSKHPEYYSMINGARQGQEAQLCLTNPEVVNIASNTVFRWIVQHPEASIFSIDQNDGYGYCECPSCSALDESEGSHSATVINFVNQIADTVAKVYPDIKLQTLAYVYSEVPPRTIRPAGNVTIRMCHYDYCSAHPLEGCESHKPFIERLEAWHKITERITIWDYFTNYSRYLMPYPNFERMKNDVRYYADFGCVGLFAQGSNVPDNGGGEFSSLRAWVFAQLMWDPWQDGQALIDEFVTDVYGRADPYISQYIRLLHDQVKPDSVYFSIYAEPTDGGYLTPELVNKAEALFVKAEKEVADDTALLKRVELAHLPVIYTRLYFYSTGGQAFLSKEEMPAVLEKFERIITEHKITRMAEREDVGNIRNFIERVKEGNTFITDWWLIGPFDNTDENGLQIIYPPEQEFDTSGTYTGSSGRPVKWEQYNNEISGYIDFAGIYKPSDNGVAYAQRIIHMDEEKDVQIGIGSNDGVRMWVNGELILDHKVGRKAEPNQEILTVHFQKGDNTVLLKIDQLGGGWGFYFSIL
jgi:hypothetical protein